MKVLYDNKVKTATITALTENPYYLYETGLKDTRLSRVGRTLAVSAQWIKFDLTTAASVTNVIINNHNLTAGATVTLEGHATDVWTAPTVSESLSVSAVIYKTFTGASLRYWRITITDAGNTDGYLQIGSVFLGTSLTMPGFNIDGALVKESNSEASFSLSGQMYGQSRLQYKTADLDFVSFTHTEWLTLKPFVEYVDTVNPFYMIIWEDDVTIEPPVYCAFTSFPKRTKNGTYGLTYRMTANIREVF